MARGRRGPREVQRGSEAGWLHMRTWRGESDRSVSLAAKRRLLGSPWSKGGDDPLSLVRQEPEISRYEGPNMDESCNLHLPRQKLTDANITHNAHTYHAFLISSGSHAHPHIHHHPQPTRRPKELRPTLATPSPPFRSSRIRCPAQSQPIDRC